MDGDRIFSVGHDELAAAEERVRQRTQPKESIEDKAERLTKAVEDIIKMTQRLANSNTSDGVLIVSTAFAEIVCAVGTDKLKLWELAVEQARKYVVQNVEKYGPNCQNGRS